MTAVQRIRSTADTDGIVKDKLQKQKTEKHPGNRKHRPRA